MTENVTKQNVCLVPFLTMCDLIWLKSCNLATLTLKYVNAQLQ